MVRLRLLLAAAALIAGCSQSPPRGSPLAAQPSTTKARECASSKVSTTAQPAWTLSAGSLGAPIAVSDQNNAAAFHFGSLRAGHPTNPTNKILWVVREPRNGQTLHVAAVDGSTTPTVTYTFPANSSPGEIYPSIVDVPASGCWRFSLQWNGHHADLSLPYAPAS